VTAVAAFDDDVALLGLSADDLSTVPGRVVIRESA
jgi:hypothetical protein